MANAELIRCHQVSCGYREHPVISGVDLTVRAGQITSILGGSGSGKSTLLKTLAGVLPPVAGELTLLGQDPYALDAARRRELHARIGMLYQGDALFGSMSVIDNVALPLRELTNLPPPAVELAARARLLLLDVLEVEQRFPAEISGGQSKRVALARSTILDPPILFCDEPTSALDPLAAAQVDSMLLRLRDAFSMAIVAVTHDPASVRDISDQVVALAQGKIEAIGDVAEIERRVPSFFERSAGKARGSDEAWARG